MKKFYSDFRCVAGMALFTLVAVPALTAPLWTPYSPGLMEISERLLPPSSTHWLGTDLRGIDVWTSLLYGARISLSISFVTTLISNGLGTTLGLLAGYWCGWPELILMRIIDVVLAFPGMILSLTLASLWTPSYLSLTLALILPGWVAPARLIRMEVLSLKERDYITAAQALGTPPLTILGKHLFPATLPLLFTQMANSFAGAILVESSLSFLGLGPKGNFPTWGQLLNEGRSVLLEAPALTIAPGICLFITLFGVHLLGESQWD